MVKDVYDMTDEELEAAFRAAKAEINSTEVTNDVVNDTNDLEQPIEDSNDNTNTDIVEEVDNSEDSNSVETNHESEVKTEEEQSEEENTESTEEEKEEREEEKEQPVQTYKFKANGKEYEFTLDEIIEKFPTIFGQAMDYTKKSQELKPWRKAVDALKSAQLTPEDVNLAIDVLKGDKAAISEVLKRHKIDTLDLDVENSSYVAKDYGRDEATLNLAEVLDSIKSDPEYITTSSILSNKWDDSSFQEMVKNPELIRLLHIDVKTGVFDKVQAIADKLKVFDKAQKSDLEYYKEASIEYFSKLEQERARLEAQAKAAKIAQVKAQNEQIKETKEKAALRKAAAITKSIAGTAKPTNYLDASDEAFEEWYNQLQSRY